jgi:hypothetical protein
MAEKSERAEQRSKSLLAALVSMTKELMRRMNGNYGDCPYNHGLWRRPRAPLPSKIRLFSANLTRHSLSNGIMLKSLKTNNRCHAHSTLQGAFAASASSTDPPPRPSRLFYVVAIARPHLNKHTTKSFLTYRGTDNRVGGCRRTGVAGQEDSETVARFSRCESATGQLSVVGLGVGVPASVWDSRAS